MNKKLLIAMSVFAFSLAAKAASQTSTATESAQGSNQNFLKPYVGVSSFNIDGIADDFSSKGGFVVGAAYLMPTPGQNLAVEAGLEFLQAGAQREYVWVSSGGTAIKQELNLTYLAIPVKARYQIFQQPYSTVNYSAIGGVTVAHMLSAKSKTETFGVSDETDMTSDFNTTDVMASIGFGAETEMFAGKANLDIEYTRGFLDVTKDGGGHNSGFVVKAGYSLQL
ncbi:outer membrane beta-barrel protein [Bdellovibrio sp. HCB274]|uniref:outer membrane beta-barrel protein n=1 Tax=Bdellovibrio sp. HCB274 TaxID=3394361 RepID=UPI0039B3B8C0